MGGITAVIRGLKASAKAQKVKDFKPKSVPKSNEKKVTDKKLGSLRSRLVTLDHKYPTSLLSTVLRTA